MASTTTSLSAFVDGSTWLAKRAAARAASRSRLMVVVPSGEVAEGPVPPPPRLLLAVCSTQYCRVVGCRERPAHVVVEPAVGQPDHPTRRQDQRMIGRCDTARNQETAPIRLSPIVLDITVTSGCAASAHQ